MNIVNVILCFALSRVSAFWDIGTTTLDPADARYDQWLPRICRFRWQRSESNWYRLLFPYWNWYELEFRRNLYVIAGLSHEMINLGTAAILNRRTVLTAANLLDPYMDRPTELRVWALGRGGWFTTPWRYRVWRVTRVFPKSLNPEHCHGSFCYHSPRHDISIVHTLDQMYLFHEINHRYAYATRALLSGKYQNLLSDALWFAGSGFEYDMHVLENFKIFYAKTWIRYVKDCTKYLPKWWGKFICVLNEANFPCVQNGGPLFTWDLVVGLGCFSITYNDETYLAFTDIRYYIGWIHQHARIHPGEYYEYAYPQWGASLVGYDMDKDTMEPKIPGHQLRDGLFPLGKKKK